MGIYEDWDAKKSGPQQPPSGPREPVQFAPGEVGSPYGTKALDDEVRAVGGARTGERNDQLNRSTFAIMQLVRAGHLDEDRACAALTLAARQNGLTGMEIVRTMNSAKGGAERNPRLNVPDPNEVAGPAVADVRWTPPGAVVRPGRDIFGLNEAVGGGGRVPVDIAPADTGLYNLGPPPAPPMVEVGLSDTTWPDVPPAIDWHELWADERTEEWIIEPLLAVGRGTAIYSEPKVGKSLICLEMAVAVSMGRHVLGDKPSRPFKVLYVDFENDPRGDVRTRLEDMGYGPEDLGNLSYLSFPTLSALDSAQGGNELMFAVEHYGAEAVFIDTVSRAIKGAENENDTWLQFYRSTGLKLKQARVALVRLDHAGKDATKGQRGGSAKGGDVDMVWRLSEVVKDKTYRMDCEMKRMQISPEFMTMTLHRKSDPLRHEVDPMGWRGSSDSKRDEIVGILDAAGHPITGKEATSRRAAERVLKAHKENYPDFTGVQGKSLDKILVFRAVSRSDTPLISESVSEHSGHTGTQGE